MSGGLWRLASPGPKSWAGQWGRLSPSTGVRTGRGRGADGCCYFVLNGLQQTQRSRMICTVGGQSRSMCSALKSSGRHDSSVCFPHPPSGWAAYFTLANPDKVACASNTVCRPPVTVTPMRDSRHQRVPLVGPGTQHRAVEYAGTPGRITVHCHGG